MFPFETKACYVAMDTSSHPVMSCWVGMLRTYLEIKYIGYVMLPWIWASCHEVEGSEVTLLSSTGPIPAFAQIKRSARSVLYNDVISRHATVCMKSKTQHTNNLLEAKLVKR